MNKNYLYPGFIDEVKGCLNKGSGSGGGGEPVDAYTKTQTDNLLLNKVDKEDGKGLFSGSYNDLSDTPTIPTKTSQLDNDSNFATNESVDEINNNLEAHIGNKQNPHGVTKSQIGLGNVENKSSATIRSELTSSNVTTALGYTPLNSAKKGSANGVAELGSDGKVPSSQLPSYVDDVLEYSSKSSFPSTGEAGKIYVDTSTNLTYRWSGSAYVEISQSLALGETSSTAYRGDRGKIAYEHSQKTSGNPHGVTKSDVGLGNVENTADNDKVVKSLIDSSGATVAGGKVGELTYYSSECSRVTTSDIAGLEVSPSSGGYSLKRMPISTLKSKLGVDKVDNTADLDKPISTATQTALDEINSNLSKYSFINTTLLDYEVSDGQLSITLPNYSCFGIIRFCEDNNHKMGVITINKAYFASITGINTVNLANCNSSILYTGKPEEVYVIIESESIAATTRYKVYGVFFDLWNLGSKL